MKTTPFKSVILIAMVAIGGFLLMGCHNPPKPQSQIKRIEIASGGCLRRCPVVGVQIDSTLTLKYYGGYKAKPEGYYAGTITQGAWDTLNIKLKQINFDKLDTAHYYGMDGEVVEAIFYWDNHRRHIFAPVDDDDTGKVSTTLKWIINSYRHIPLNPLKDSVKFETTYQLMRVIPPNPKINQVKFPPPGK